MPTEDPNTARAKELEEAVRRDRSEKQLRDMVDAAVGAAFDKHFKSAMDAAFKSWRKDADEGEDEDGEDKRRRDRRDRRRDRHDEEPTPLEHAGEGEGGREGELPNGPRRQSEMGREAAVDSKRRRRDRRDNTEHGEDWGAGGGDGHPNPGRREPKVDEMSYDDARLDARQQGELREKFTAVQVAADEVALHWNMRADRFMPGESYRDYRVRLLGPYVKYSPEWKDVDLHTIDPVSLGVAEKQIRQDAIKASKTGDGEIGVLRQVTTVDDSGRKITRFYGDWNAAFGLWRSPLRGARVRPQKG
jgi:hypothetical protein